MAKFTGLPQIDQSRWPAVVVTMPDRAMRDDEFAAYLNELDGVWRNGSRFGVIIDVRTAPPLPPSQRRMVAESLDRHTEQYPDLLQGVAVIIANSVQRGIVAVLMWLMKRPFELQTFATVELGEAWVLHSLTKPSKPSRKANVGLSR